MRFQDLMNDLGHCSTCKFNVDYTANEKQGMHCMRLHEKPDGHCPEHNPVDRAMSIHEIKVVM